MTAKTIKFFVSKDGEIEARNGCTIFSDLFTFGAFAGTRKFNNELHCHDYKTDNEGLKFLEMKSGEAVDLLSGTVVSLGAMLAYTQTGELTDTQMNDIAWLFAGLGELIGMVSEENASIQYTLTQLNKNQQQAD